jgi:hypothetical protein
VKLRTLPLSGEWFSGAVSLQLTDSGIKPWRIPYQDYGLYTPDGIDGKAAICAGVRLRLTTDSLLLALPFSPLEEAAVIDCVTEGRLYSVSLIQGAAEAVFRDLPEGMKTLEIFLPQNTGLTITGIQIEASAVAEPSPDLRPRWVTYGSSITQCVAASSPSRTWPAIAAAAGGYNLTCLGPADQGPPGGSHHLMRGHKCLRRGIAKSADLQVRIDRHAGDHPRQAPSHTAVCHFADLRNGAGDGGERAGLHAANDA